MSHQSWQPGLLICFRSRKESLETKGPLSVLALWLLNLHNERESRGSLLTFAFGSSTALPGTAGRAGGSSTIPPSNGCFSLHWPMVGSVEEPKDNTFRLCATHSRPFITHGIQRLRHWQ